MTVTLRSGATCSGAVVATATTDATGAYSFGGAVPGLAYSVCETQPAGYGQGATNPGAGATSPAADAIAIAALPAGGSAGNNFGETLGSLSGAVYQDNGAGNPANADNGVRDAGEPGIGGVPITLTGRDITGAAVSLSTLTDASGAWRFDNLLQSDATGYSVVEGAIPPASGTYGDGKDTVGSAGGSAAVNDRFTGIVLGAGVQAAGYLFGELPQAAVSGVVYLDRNRSGAIDAEPTDGRIAGVTVTLRSGPRAAARSSPRRPPTPRARTRSAAPCRGWTTASARRSPPATARARSIPARARRARPQTRSPSPSCRRPAARATTSASAPLSLPGSVFLDANNDGVRRPATPASPASPSR